MGGLEGVVAPVEVVGHEEILSLLVLVESLSWSLGCGHLVRLKMMLRSIL